MKVEYTASGKEELLEFQSRQQKLLEELIAEKKYVIGDETLEVTATDIKETQHRLRPVSRYAERRALTTRLILPVYVLGGVGMMIYAFFHKDIQRVIYEQEVLWSVGLAGLLTTIAGIFFSWYLNERNRRIRMISREEQRIREQLEAIDASFTKSFRHHGGKTPGESQSTTP